MTYFEELEGKNKPIRQLARELDLSYETVRDRLNRDTPPDKRRHKIPMSKVIRAEELMKDGFTISQVSRLLEVPRSSIHRKVSVYRKSLIREANEEEN